MRYENIPANTSSVILKCVYEEFQMTLKSMENNDFENIFSPQQWDYSVLHDKKTTMELKTYDESTYNTLLKIMQNYKNTISGTYPPLSFTLQTRSDFFSGGYITSISENLLDENISFVFFIDFNNRESI